MSDPVPRCSHKTLEGTSAREKTYMPNGSIYLRCRRCGDLKGPFRETSGGKFLLRARGN